MKVEPVDSSPATPAAPCILTPVRSVVPAKSAVVFAPPTRGSTIRARFVPDGATDEVEFCDVRDAAILLDGNGTLEAFSVDARSGARSGSIRVAFSTYQDLTVKDDAWKAGFTAVDLADRFTATEGTMKANGSFLAPAMNLMGEPVKRGVSTRGDTALNCVLDPSWRIFTVRVGIDDAEDRRPCARFQVYFDNQLASETSIVNPTKLQLADEERRVFTLSVRIPDVRNRYNSARSMADSSRTRTISCGLSLPRTPPSPRNKRRTSSSSSPTTSAGGPAVLWQSAD